MLRMRGDTFSKGVTSLTIDVSPFQKGETSLIDYIL